MSNLLVEVVVGTYDSMVKGLSYDIQTNSSGIQPGFNERSHLGKVSALASHRGVLASGSSDETIKLYNMKDRTELGTLMLHEGTITCLKFCKDKLVSCGEDGLICVWNSQTWECIHCLKGHRGVVYSVAVHPSGKVALSVGGDRTIRTWDLVKGQQAFTKKLPSVSELVVWSPVSDQYLVAFNYSLVLYDVLTGRQIQDIAIGKHINSTVFIQDSVIAVGCELPEILVYSTHSGQCITRLTGHENRVKSLEYLVEASLLFSISSDGSVMIWKIKDDDLTSSCCISHCRVTSRLTCMTLVVFSQDLFDKQTTNPPETTGPVKISKKLIKKKRRKISSKNRSRTSIKRISTLTRQKRHLLKKMIMKKKNKSRLPIST